MAQTRVGIQQQSVWMMEATCCVGEAAAWRFDDRDDVGWFSVVAQQYWRARCPRCGLKDIVSLRVDESPPLEWEALAACGNQTCSFAERIVSWGDPEETP